MLQAVEVPGGDPGLGTTVCAVAGSASPSRSTTRGVTTTSSTSEGRALKQASDDDASVAVEDEGSLCESECVATGAVRRPFAWPTDTQIDRR